MGVVVIMASGLPALTRKSKKFWVITKKWFSCQITTPRRHRSEYRHNMSLMEHGGVRPITAVAWTSNSSTCPKDFTMISITEDGAAANFTRSFGMKSGYYLCYSKDLTGGMVVSDIQLISDKDSIPHGYSYMAEHLEQKASVSKKKRVCIRVVPVGSVDTAVLDIKLTAKSKMMLQHYTYVGNPPPPPAPQGKLSQRRHSLHSKDNSDKLADSSIHGITALDGVPFGLHPKFDMEKNNTTHQLSSQLNKICIKSLQDIENEYNYTFTVEESAAKRNQP
ncbi:multivesicular body subunit 12A isoform X3 [Channa argus]|uniref:multivesicular body subunit 12A isoform X3 n=1 Tax=Channa argus TaxID=215402 RepID=UPI0035224CA0